MSKIDQSELHKFTENLWDNEIIPEMIKYIQIPNKSPLFEPDWEQLGHMERAVELMASWAQEKISSIPDAKLNIERLPGRTPLIFIDIPGAGEDTVLLYGHLDKQPEMTGWDEEKGPWKPVLGDEKLFGRGAADDGYAMYSALASLLALREQDVPHARAVIVIESSEESGSPDLPFYFEALSERIGIPSLVVCLDSGCGDYDRLWLTTSLRGLVAGTLSIDVLNAGVHSGDASGIVPSSFRVLREILDRVEDAQTGKVKIEALNAPIPEHRVEQARGAAQVLGDQVYAKFPFVRGMQPSTSDLTELVLNRTWRPALSVTGFSGAPTPEEAGNVLRPQTAVKISMRLPPTVNAHTANNAMKDTILSNPPNGATISYEFDPPCPGWDAPETATWLENTLAEASHIVFGNPMAVLGEGGGIPFMNMLGERFPNAQFVVTGVLGPNSNAHGPNEFLHIPTAKRVTEAVAHVLAAHAIKDQ